jgi:hypothetical protein
MNDSNQIYQPTPALAGVMQNVLWFRPVSAALQPITSCWQQAALKKSAAQAEQDWFEFLRYSTTHATTLQPHH